MPYSSWSHLKKARFASVCASVEPSFVLLIQEKYWDSEGVLSVAPGITSADEIGVVMRSAAIAAARILKGVSFMVWIGGR